MKTDKTTYHLVHALRIFGHTRTASACASTQSDQGLRCSLTESLKTIECFNGEQMSTWDFAHVCEECICVHFAHARRYIFAWRDPFVVSKFFHQLTKRYKFLLFYAVRSLLRKFCGTMQYMMISYHYENMHIHIYWNFFHQKLKIFTLKILIFFSYFCPKHRSWWFVRTASMRRFQCVPIIHVFSRNKKNKVYPCKPQFYYIKVG